MTVKIHQADRGSVIDRWPVLMPSFVWLFALAAGFIASVLRGADVESLLPLFLAGALPGIIGVVLSRFTDREWIQIILMLSWAGLAVMACVTLGFMPLALLLITVPAIASLFQREKVLEGIVIAALMAIITWVAAGQDFLPEPPFANTAVGDWASLSAMSGLLAFILSTLFATALRRSQVSLETGRTYWRDGVEGGLFEYDATGQLSGTNEQGLAQFAGNVPSDLMDFLPEDHADQAPFVAVVDLARRTFNAQVLRVSHAASGETANYDLRITPLTTKGWLVHACDRTDAEAQLEVLRQNGATAAQDSTDKTLFFAGVSHELRTPLNAIIGFSDMMRSRLFGPLPGKYAEYADLIHESGQHMLDLIGDVLDMSKIEAGRYELNYDTFDAADVIRSSVKMIRPAADAAEVVIDVNLDLDQALLIQADRRAVRQILLNLLSNAVKFSHKGGHIDVDAQAIDGDLELSVSDTGVGMSAEELSRIGDPYLQGEAGQTSDERGTGLGLALVQSLTELHEGKVNVRSEKGEGTRFKIILPLQVD